MFFNFYISFRSLQVTAYGTGTNYLCLTSSYNTRKKVKKKVLKILKIGIFRGIFRFFLLSLVTRTVAPRRLKNASITHSPYLRPTFDPKSESNRLSDTRTNKMRQKGDQFTNAPFDRPLIAICSHFCCPGTPLANKKRNIFFCSPYRCPGNHFTNGIRILSTFATHSFFCSFFVRIKSAMATEWRMKYEQLSMSS